MVMSAACGPSPAARSKERMRREVLEASGVRVAASVASPQPRSAIVHWLEEGERGRGSSGGVVGDRGAAGFLPLRSARHFCFWLGGGLMVARAWRSAMKVLIGFWGQMATWARKPAW